MIGREDDDERERLILRNHDGGQGGAASSSSSSSFYWSRKKTFITIALAVGAGVAIATGTTTTASPRGSVGTTNTAVAGGHRRPRGILPSAKLGVINEGVAANAPVGGKNHFFNGLLVREDERALLQKYTTKIPSRREIEKMETEEAAASLGGYDDTRRREQRSEDDTPFAAAEAAGLGAMPRRSWKKSSEKAKEEQSQETKEFLAALGEVEKPSPALLEAATKLLREKHGEETPLDAKQQREAEEMTANTIALVRAEKSVVQNKKKKGSSETSEPSSTTASSPTEDKKEDDKIKPSQPQSLLEIAENFLKSEEEAKSRAEAEIEAAAKEEGKNATHKKEEVEGQPSEEKKEDEGKVEASAEEEDDKPSPKAIEFAKLLLAGEVKKVEPADGSEAEAKKIDGVLGKPTPDILAAARQMLLKAGVNLDAEKSFASTSALKSIKVKEMTSTLRDKSIASAQDDEGKKIPKRSWVPKLGEDTDDANKAAAAAADSSEASTPRESANNDNINNEQQEEGEPAQDQQVHEMPKTEDVVAEAANEIAAENEERKEGGEQEQKQQEQEQQQQEQKDGQQEQQQEQPEQQPEAGVMPKAEEQVQDNAQVEEERKEEGQDRPVVYLSQVPIKEKEVKAQQYAQEHQAQEANVGVDEQNEEGQLEIPRILADNVKLIDGDGREYMQPKAHELWNNGKTLFVYPQTEAQKQKPIPDATDLHAFVITLDKRLDLGSMDSEDTDTTMWERTQERLKEIPLIHAEKSPGVDPKAWPQSGLQEALYATGFARLFWSIHQNDPLYADLPPERRTVAELPWIGEVEKRDQNGYFRASSQGLSHHYGCLYAHLYQWQKIKDTGLKKALILESDGLGLTRVPLESIPSVAKQMPGDADFVTLQLYPYEPAGVERRNVEIKHPTSGEHKTYSFDKLNYHPQQGYAGLASYIATNTFVEKSNTF